MLRNISAIKGYGISATDGEIGKVSDFLFEDSDWRVRWLVIETGTLFARRRVLLPPSAVVFLDADQRVLKVDLTTVQVNNSPDVDTDLPVSRQMESSIYDFYGWNPYWGHGIYPGGYGFVSGPVQELPAEGTFREMQDVADNRLAESDPHLRSIAAVSGYHIEGSDGETGHVADFLLQDKDWSIEFLVVETGNWLPGKKVLVAPRLVTKIDWPEKTVEIKATHKQVMDSPLYDKLAEIHEGAEHQYTILYG